jgi:hypothetical protein
MERRREMARETIKQNEKTITPDDLHNIISECDGPVKVCVVTAERYPNFEWFSVKTTETA